jgi:hypothetical protein
VLKFTAHNSMAALLSHFAVRFFVCLFVWLFGRHAAVRSSIPAMRNSPKGIFFSDLEFVQQRDGPMHVQPSCAYE